MKYIYAIISLLLISCSRNTEQTGRSAVLDVTCMDTIVCALQDDMPLDSIISKIDYVKLRSTKNNPVGAIDALWVTEDHIIAADYNQSETIFVFDRQGQLQATISRKGRGPQEYLSIMDVTLTPDRKRIAVLDNHGKKILYYDLAGHFLFRKELLFYPLRMRYLDEENILLTTYGLEERDPGLASYPCNKDLLFCVDTTLQIRKSFMPNQFSKELGGWCSPKVKQFDDGRVYATHVYSDTVYQVTPEGLIARYWIDLSPVGGIANFWDGLTEEKHMAMKEPMFTGALLENDRFIFFNPLGVPTILFSKKTKKCYHLGNRSSTGLGLHVSSVNFAYGDQFIAVVPAYQLCDITSRSWIDRRYQDLAEKIEDGLSEDDDPVLLFFTLKEPDASAAD